MPNGNDENIEEPLQEEPAEERPQPKQPSGPSLGQQAAEAAKKKAWESKPGQAVKGKVEEAKQKAKEAAVAKGKQIAAGAAKKLGIQAAKTGAKAGAEAAAGAATGGVAAGAIEAADRISQAAKKGFQQVDKFFGGRISRLWEENKWQIIGWSCAAFAFLLLMPLIIIILTASVISTTALNPEDKADQALVNEVESLNLANKLIFLDNRDLEKMKQGEIIRPVIRLLSYLGNKHTLTIARYSYGDPSGYKLGSAVNLPESEANSFSIVAVDNIKCRNMKNKENIIEFPINLSANYDWGALIKPEYTGEDKDVRCAVGYYPGDEPVKGPYADTFGPGEFSILDLASAGPKAAQEKEAEIISEILSANLELGVDPNSVNSLTPSQIFIDTISAENNLAKGGGGILEALKGQIERAYPKENNEGVIPSDANAFGIQINF